MGLPHLEGTRMTIPVIAAAVLLLMATLIMAIGEE